MSAELLPMVPSRLLLSVDEAGEQLGISARQMYRLLGKGARKGGIDPVYIGTRCLVAYDDLKAYVERLREESQ